MRVPWLRILDAVIGVTDLTRSRNIRDAARASDDQQLLFEPASRALGGLEARLAGVVVAALKEAFDRDTRRLELERAHIDAERERADRALRLELRRQAGEREIGRLRLLAATAIASWIGTLFFSARLVGGGLGGRVTLGGGWLLLLLAFALAFAAQSRVSEALNRSDESLGNRDLTGGMPGEVALWFIVAGLGLVGLAVLVA